MEAKARHRHGQGTESDPYIAGNYENPRAKKMRIVHISDTHMRHDHYVLDIPHGDVLVHSGDFSNAHLTRRMGDREAFETVTREMNRFFSRLPHDYKLFVAGNHETSFSPYAIFGTNLIQANLPYVTYVQDCSVHIDGVTFYGSPWTSSKDMAFSTDNLKKHWHKIPTETDVLITHMPPFNILDLAYSRFKADRHERFTEDQRERGPRQCIVCRGAYHVDKQHLGCEDLRETVLKDVRPKLHLFGHVHEQTGLEMHDGIVFSNATMDLFRRANVIDYYYTTDTENDKVVGKSGKWYLDVSCSILL